MSLNVDHKGGKPAPTEEELWKLAMGQVARTVAHKLEAEEAKLLRDHMTWRVQLPQASLDFIRGDVTCRDGNATVKITLSEPPVFYDQRGEKGVIFDGGWGEKGRPILTVTADGLATYESDATRPQWNRLTNS
jgi:hypothetical protein